MPGKPKLQRWELQQRPGPGARCIGQIRVSTMDQVDGQSLPAQQRAIAQKAAEYGWTMAGWSLEPGESAKDDFASRPIWDDLVHNQAGRDCDAIISHSASRWCRNPAYDWIALETLRSKGVWWECIVERMDINADRETGQDIVAAIRRTQNAAYIRELAREVHKGKLENARQGYLNGHSPFGYQYPTEVTDATSERGKRRREVYVPHPRHFETVQKIGELVAEHPPRSLSRVAMDLNRLGYVYEPYRGEPRSFTAMILRKILLRPYYRAYRPDGERGTIILPTQEGEEVEGLHVAAWSWELWQRIAQNRLIRKQLAHGARTYGPTEHVLTYSGLLVCAACGGTLPAMHAATYSGKRYMYYRMDVHRNADCPIAQRASVNRMVKKAIREEVLDRQMGTLLARMGGFSDTVRTRIEFLHRQGVVSGNTVGGSAVDYAGLRKRLGAKRARINDLYIEGEISKEERQRRLAEVDRELAAVPVDISPDMPKLAVQAVAAIEGLADYWERLTEAWPRPESEQEVRELRHGLLIKLFEPKGIVVDLERQVIVGLRPHPSLLEAVSLMLEADGWREAEPGVLRREISDDDNQQGRVIVRGIYDALAAGHGTVAEAMQYIGTRNHWALRDLLLLAYRRGLVSRVRERPPNGGMRYRYTLTSEWERWALEGWWPPKYYLPGGKHYGNRTVDGRSRTSTRHDATSHPSHA